MKKYSELTNELTLVDFFATWCGPCKAVAPVLDELSDELKDVKVVKVDVDAEPELARSHRVMSIPTFFVYKDKTAVINDANAKLRKNILGVNISNIKNAIPIKEEDLTQEQVKSLCGLYKKQIEKLEIK